MNNSVFGKAMENIDKRVDIRLVTNKEAALKLVARPNYNSLTFFDNNLIAGHTKKTKVYYNKPVYIGLCTLDISKSLMYDFHYNYIKEKYKDKAKLLFTDTDSLIYHIATEDVYADISNDVDKWFDTIDYKEDHPSRIRTEINKKVPGKFRDEASDNKLKKLLLYVQNHIQSRCMKGRKTKSVKESRKP